jgi:hypothetical protein
VGRGTVQLATGAESEFDHDGEVAGAFGVELEGEAAGGFGDGDAAGEVVHLGALAAAAGFLPILGADVFGLVEGLVVGGIEGLFEDPLGAAVDVGGAPGALGFELSLAEEEAAEADGFDDGLAVA